MKTKIVLMLVLFINACIIKAQYSIEILDSLSDGTVKFANIHSTVKSNTTDDSKSLLKEVLKAGAGTDFYYMLL